MKYKFTLIGERLRILREEAGMSQDKFIEVVSNNGVKLGRNNLSKFENGELETIKLGLLLAYCKIFNVDMGYLLGEYDCETKEAADIQKAIGLSEKAIGQIIERKNENGTGQIEVLSHLLQDAGFWSILMNIRNAAESTAIAKNDESDEKQIEWKYIYGKQSAILRGQGISDHYLNTAINSFTAIIKNYVESSGQELARELAEREKLTKDFLETRGINNNE